MNGRRRLGFLVWKLRVASRAVRVSSASALRWVRESNERTNFTYDLAPLNRQHLAAFVAVVAGIRQVEAEGYMAELEEDTQLSSHVAGKSAGRDFADATARFGRRAGWYALARALKPEVIIETGVDKGLGSIVLAAALMRNNDEGYPGRYWGVDIDPTAGWLFDGPYMDQGELVVSDSHSFLRSFGSEIDMLICDADHTPGYERFEYVLAEPQLGQSSVIISDTAHHNTALLDYATETSRRFLYFQESPVRHWYPGAGIGIAWSPEQ